MLGKNSIWCKRFQKFEILSKFRKFQKISKFWKNVEGCAPALRVIRAGTRLTVHRSLPYWCNRNTRPQSTEFFCNVHLFGDVFGEQNHHDMRKWNYRSEFHVLKFHFGWVWASGDVVNAISIWLQISVMCHFCKISVEIPKILKFKNTYVRNYFFESV